MIDLVKNLASVNRRTKASVIRELLKMTSRPGMISFAGGMPDPDCFPNAELAEIFSDILKHNSKSALQYGSTEGTAELKGEILKYLQREEGITAKPENILVTTASQQALDLVSKAFIDPADPVIVEVPSYLGALQVFASYGAKMYGIPCDDDGMRTDLLEKQLAHLKKEEEHYKFIYSVTDFQNPAGVTLSEERRRKFVSMAKKYKALIIEDLPYRQVRFEGKNAPTLYKLDSDGNVISLFTFSKTMVPGFRLGYILAHEDIIARLGILKQTTDLCTGAFQQLVAAEFMRRGMLNKHIAKVCKVYKSKRDVMLAALKKYMPEGVEWTSPQGGLFLWVRLPANMDADTMFPRALDNKVAYVIGSAFHHDGSGKNTMRLNFSYPTHEQIEEGIHRLADVIKKEMCAATRSCL
ncbi:MAG: PLP-dependent aminotransferase family protein [Elusimicrobia bacterium]|nr:PLP-dependent aminotransferase family protein [Elusimicrobiota bacterium]